MQKKIYLLVGVPGSGKSWVAKHLDHKFNYVPHDLYREGYTEAVNEAFESNDLRPVLCETPFSISKIKEPLEAIGLSIDPIFIIEDPDTISSRYYEREGKPIPKGHLTRLQTYIERAHNLGAFTGTSDEVLEYLRSK